MLFCSYQKLKILRDDVNMKRVRVLCHESKVLEIKQITWKGNMHVINMHTHTHTCVRV